MDSAETAEQEFVLQIDLLTTLLAVSGVYFIAYRKRMDIVFPSQEVQQSNYGYTMKVLAKEWMLIVGYVILFVAITTAGIFFDIFPHHRKGLASGAGVFVRSIAKVLSPLMGLTLFFMIFAWHPFC